MVSTEKLITLKPKNNMEIAIENKPFSKTEYYGGEYIYKTEQGSAKYLFTLCVMETASEINWLEDVKPANHEEVESEIILQFHRR